MPSVSSAPSAVKSLRKGVTAKSVGLTTAFPGIWPFCLGFIQTVSSILRTWLYSHGFPKALLSSPGECKRLEKALLRFEKAAQLGKKDGTAEAEMDEILMQAYGLERGPFWERLVTVYNWDSVGASRISLDDSTLGDGADWIVQGTVVEVRAAQGEVRMWLNSFDEPQTVSIVPAMPGWLLRPEVKFVTRVPASEVQAGVLTGKCWGRFVPELYTYLSQIEIARTINAKMFRNKGSKR